MALSKRIQNLIATGKVTAGDVSHLRRAYYGGNGCITADEAAFLFKINEACEAADEAWPKLFVEALCDHVVYQAEPRGYVSEENADWLIERISHNGVVAKACELELIIKIMETAADCPQSFEQFALAQVKAAVLTGAGPTRHGLKLAPGVIGEAEVDVLQRIVHAHGGGRGIAVSKAEAEVLFDIADATAGAANHPAWTEFFVKAIANCIMSVSGYVSPPREQVLNREVSLGDDASDVAGFMGRLFADGLRNVLKAYESDQAAYVQRLRDQQADIAEAQHITLPEADWLCERLMRDGKLADREKALLAFVAEQSDKVHPALKRLIEQAA